MIKGREQVKADNLRQRVVERLGIERKVDVVKRQVSNDLDGVDSTPNGLHVELEGS